MLCSRVQKSVILYYVTALNYSIGSIIEVHINNDYVNRGDVRIKYLFKDQFTSLLRYRTGLSKHGRGKF